jgi:hypothetical protein
MSGILMMSVGNSYGSLPVNTVAPVVSGAARVGQTLSTTNGTWTGAPAPTFTYQWQRVTTNISGATSSTYVLQSADIGSTIRCVVTATNPSGAVSANSNNTDSIGAAIIGDPFGGGFLAGQISTTANSVATHNLVIGPFSSAQFTGAWKTSNTSTPGTDSLIDGPANTAAMIAAGAAAHPCGEFCDNLVVGGFSDWYMPAQNELEICYFNLKPSTELNNTSSGINPNAVPARASNYTAINPALTNASAFQYPVGSEAFELFLYWASNQLSPRYGRHQNMNYGRQAYTDKNTTNRRVRAVRRVPV